MTMPTMIAMSPSPRIAGVENGLLHRQEEAASALTRKARIARQRKEGVDGEEREALASEVVAADGGIHDHDLGPSSKPEMIQF